MTTRHEKPTFCEYRTTYDLDRVMNGSTFASWAQYYATREAEVLRDPGRFAAGDLTWLRVEARWYALRRPVYRVYPSMAVALPSTNLEVPSHELRFPFEAVTVAFPARTVFMDPTMVVPQDREALRGLPYVCAIMAIERPLEAADRQELGAERAVSLMIDMADDDPLAYREGRLTFLLRADRTIADCVTEPLRHSLLREYAPCAADVRRLAALVTAVLFLATGRDRKYVTETRIKPYPAEPCLCGSGKKHKRCCGASRATSGQPIGYEVGRHIDLPYRSSNTTGVTLGDGRQLEFGHIRSGHMRWQPRKDDAREWTRELIFVAPTVVRPDLPLKPTLTPRRVRAEPELVASAAPNQPDIHESSMGGES
jgi:hypothetical protein